MKKVIRISAIIIILSLLSFMLFLPIEANNTKNETNDEYKTLLDEEFILHDYETNTDSTFTYRDVVEEYRELNPEYTNPTERFIYPKQEAELLLSKNAIIQNNRSIIPGSTMYPVSDVTEAPYSGIVMILSKDSSGNNYFGTGYMVSKRVLVTCAHVVKFDGVYASEIKIYPLLDHDKTVINGVSSINNVTDYYHPYSWVTPALYDTTTGEERDKYDWCYLSLSVPTSSDVGYFNFGPIMDNVQYTYTKVSGYPMISSGSTYLSYDMFDDYEQYNQYTSSTGTSMAYNSHRIIHNCSAIGGQSGSPIYIYMSNYAIGIHTGGGLSNYGIRFYPTLENLIRNKINSLEG